jgi:hypothetical protein
LYQDSRLPSLFRSQQDSVCILTSHTVYRLLSSPSLFLV